jgi:hypothetical protein
MFACPGHAVTTPLRAFRMHHEKTVIPFLSEVTFYQRHDTFQATQKDRLVGNNIDNRQRSNHHQDHKTRFR